MSRTCWRSSTAACWHARAATHEPAPSLLAVELNLADLFEAVAGAVPEREALVCRGSDGIAVRRSYAELDARADRAAQALAAEGIGPGDHVGLHLRNGHEFIELMVALFKLRAVPINVNHRYVADELAGLFADAGLRAVVTEPDLEARVLEVRSAMPPPAAVWVTGPGYEARLAAQPEGRVAVGARSADDRYVLYTGGTTGNPKGVVWRHEDIYFASLGGRGTPSQGIAPVERPEQVVDRALGHDPIRRRLPLCPLIHGGAMWIALQSLLSGGTLVLDTDHHLDPTAALDLMAGERVELIMLIGDATARPLVDALAAEPDRWDLSHLQVVASGGAVLSSAVTQRWRCAGRRRGRARHLRRL